MDPEPSRLSPLDRFLWDHAGAGSAPTLSQALAAAYPDSTPDQLTLWTVTAGRAEPFNSLLRHGGAEQAIGETLGDLQLLWIPHDRGQFVVGVWPTGYPRTYHLVGTVPVTDPRWRRVERWINRAGPRLFVPNLKESEFEDILASLSHAGDTRVSRLTSRALEDGSSDVRGWKAGAGRPPYEEALREIRGKGFTPRSITLDVVGRLSLLLRRDSGATFYGGDFALFEVAVMNAFAVAGNKRWELLSGRERSGQELRPIRILLPDDALAEPDALETLVDSLSQAATSVAVLHRNPYVHMTLTNYNDGSNMDAFVFRDDELLIYPGYTASAGALARLAAELSARFAGAEVDDAPAAAPPTDEELLTTG